MLQDYSLLSVNDLAGLLHKGSPKAFNTLFERYWKRLYAYAFRIYPNEKICEDIVQELFIILWEKHKDTIIKNLEGYLFRAVKYSIATHLRDRKFTALQEGVISTLAMPSAAERKLELQDLENALDRSIGELSPRCRTVFKLSRFDHRSNLEISEKLDISIRTVEKHISDAIAQLRVKVNLFHLLLVFMLTFL